MKIVFNGDSITDFYRDRSDPHHLGRGYVKYVGEQLRAVLADEMPELLNFGIGGETTEQLINRFRAECIETKPDIVVILIGINDAAFGMSDEVYADHLDRMFSALKTETQARLIVLEPFLTEVPSRVGLREQLNPIIKRCRAAAVQYADLFLPLDGLLAAECLHHTAEELCDDGVHPTKLGAAFIAGYVTKAILSFIR